MISSNTSLSGKYAAYPEYKDSEISWVGKIPKHWCLIKGGYIGQLFGSESISGEQVINKGILPFIKVSDLALDGFSCKQFSWFVAETKAQYCRSEKNYVVFPKRGAAIFTNKVNVIKVKSVIDPNLMGWKISDIAISEYIAHLLKIRGLNDIADVSTVPQINNKHIAPEKFPIPSVQEQQTIVNFLDHETAKIDTLIDKQQQLITLLKEKRQAVISHAVTKGLNPNAPMRDSGVEWLGEVPEGWVSCPLKYYAIIVDCKHITAEFFDEGIPLASIGEVKEWHVNLATAKFTNKKYYLDLIDGGREPKTGDVIYSRNATVGEAALVTKDMPKFAMGQDVCLIRLNNEVLPEYLLHLLKSDVISNQLTLAMVGSTFKRINVDDIRDFSISLPPYEEQVKIVCKLTHILNKYDSLTDHAETIISLITERRTALISAAVTGKIDVRNWQPLQDDNAQLRAAV